MLSSYYKSLPKLVNPDSQGSHFSYLAKNCNRKDIFCINKAWIFQDTKALYSNSKLSAFWQNECILHGTVFDFCTATVSSIKCIINRYTLTGIISFINTPAGAYAASQTTVLHMKRLSQTESPIFVILCVLCYQRQTFLTFISFDWSTTGV